MIEQREFFLVTSLPSREADHTVDDLTATQAQREYLADIERIGMQSLNDILWNDAAHLQTAIEVTLGEMGLEGLASKEAMEALLSPAGERMLRDRFPFLHLYFNKQVGASNA
ncbi:hypothetical protein [Microvirga puerhi]|uniref:Uncharacterized protein n=1 Tax=Microvirga puerhi TaxID=2876078 RepID=A0ABS7VTP7_9HYPH|nr:hypothetical protein [Microvirga puerhi]MBZ6078943.1 hypothetical protein [Microvirga puerhi]